MRCEKTFIGGDFRDVWDEVMEHIRYPSYDTSRLEVVWEGSAQATVVIEAPGPDPELCEYCESDHRRQTPPPA